MVAGCASPLKEIKHPELPFEKRLFSIRTPQGEGWGLQKETSESVLFGKIIAKTHTVTAYIIEESAAPDFDNAEYKGYIIVLPEKYGLIAMFYSERGLAEEMLPDFEATAEEFIQGLKIRVNGKYFTEYNAIAEEIKLNKK